MRADREWMYKRLDGNNYICSDFSVGVDKFIKFACEQDCFKTNEKLKCPCTQCDLVPYMSADTIRLHLYKNGFRENYYCWSYHGEIYVESSSQNVGADFEHENDHAASSSVPTNPSRNMVMDAFHLQSDGSVQHNMVDAQEEPHPQAKRFFDLLESAEKSLYEGCKESLLSVAARITNLKCEHNIPHRAIDAFASLVKDVCPSDNLMTETFYSTRKLVKGLELPHQKIDVCRNGCMLFWKDNAQLETCGVCKADRYKKKANGKKISQKVMTYFPITPRLQRLYATKNTAKQMTWHSENQRKDGIMIHPCDGEAWKSFDSENSDFAEEPRNVRLGLCTDGFSPFGKFGKSYSCWPPLVEELKELWDVGAMTYDASRNQNFKMRASLLWTISDFPAYGMLSGWCTAGRLACPHCMGESKSFRLSHGKKETWFDCHRRFLPSDHVFRKNKSGFSKNRVDKSSAPATLTGDQILQHVSSLPTTDDGSGSIVRSKDHNWRRKSIFWELPYWSKLKIRHNLDVMHIEKNFFEQIIHTVLGDKKKTKDNKNARRDVAKHCKRPKLHLEENVTETMPKAPFVLGKEERKALCKWIQSLKFPDGYASNLSRCVNLSEGKLFGLKRHDCHVFMERLLPVAVRELLPSHVWKALTEISQFFRDLSSSKLGIEDMSRLDKNIPEIICKLERIFPPAFFNVMEHLPIHLPYEVILGGPVQYRWLYFFERFLHHLKMKVGNKAQVEGSICNAYLTEEISNFCTHYFDSKVDTKARDIGRNVSGCSGSKDVPELFCKDRGHATGSGEVKYLDDKDYKAAHGYILQNCDLLSNYESIFEDEINAKHPRMNAKDVWNKFEHNFPDWLRKYVESSDHIGNDVVKTLSIGPFEVVSKFHQYYVNGFNFQTFNYGKNKSTMNYSVWVKGNKGVDYYGILQEVIELVYGGEEKNYKTVLFKCDWFDPRSGMSVHPNYKLVDVNHTKKYPIYDPFILAYQAQQVYYTLYPSISNDKNQWWAVFPMKARSTIEAPIDQVTFQEETNNNLPLLSEPNEDVPELVHVDADDLQVESESDEEDEFLSESDTDTGNNEFTSDTNNSNFDDSSTDDDFTA